MISVLYVDDEPFLLDICKLFLEKTGEFRVQTESSAKDALKRLAHESFDALVSDYQMPEMDGIEFLKEIRSQQNFVPFIIFTGRGREEVAIAALKEGADFYLQKGGDPSAQFAELMNQIRQIVRQRTAEIAVRENEKKYRALFESALDAIFILDDGKIVECNRQMEEYFLITRQSLIGQSPGTLSPQYQLDGTNSHESALKRMNSALSGTPVLFEWKHLRGDGTEFDAEVSMNRFETGGRYLLMAVLRDISARKRSEEELHRKSEELASSYEELMSTEEELRTQYVATTQSEQALKENQANLRAIIQGSPIPQFVINRDHLVIHWNHALETYSGIAEDLIIGTDQHWKAFYPQPRPCLADLLLDGNIDFIESWYKGKYTPSPLIPGSYMATDFFPAMGEGGTWLSFTASLVRDQDGEVIGAVETLEDITSQKEALLDLAESESRYRGVIENLQDSFYRSDMDGRLIMASPSVAPLLGYDSIDECLGKDISKAFYANPAERETFRSVISRDGSVTGYQVTLKRKDGTPVLVSTNSHIYFDASGKPAGIEGTFRDITRQVEAEELLRHSQNMLQAIITGSPTPQFVIDRDHLVIQWNRALAASSHLPAEEIIGTSDQWRAFYSDKRPCLADLIVDQVDFYQEPYRSQYQPSPLVHDGYQGIDFFPAMGGEGKWLFFTAAPIRNDAGDIIGAVETLEDITERKQAETALMESEERFRTLFGNTSDAIFLHPYIQGHDPGTFIEVNDAASITLGYTHDELLTLSPLDIDASDSPDLEQIYSGVRSTGDVTYETVLRTRDNDLIPVEIKSHLYEFKGERVALSIARDISDRKRYEATLTNANKKLNLLSSITRHDILNQLTALSGYLALSEEFPLDEEIRDFIKREKKAVDTIFHQILFTRDYQTVGVQSPRWQSLKMLIQQAADLLDTGTVSVRIDMPSVAVYADPLLEKVFFNLIDNSLRYGTNVTLISFSIAHRDSSLVLICSDDGEGIPSDEKENIFNLKYFNNTGFGLFLSREILAITGLSISETGEYGRGAQFEILIPDGSYRL